LELGDLVEAGQERPVVVGRVGDALPRVEHHRVVGDPRGPNRGHPLGELAADRGDRPLVVRRQ
jgi:hypothetical protein